MLELTLTHWVILLSLATLLVVRLLQVGRRPKAFPPGPPTLPIVGNLHQIPEENVHDKFKLWAEEYGYVL